MASADRVLRNTRANR